MNILCAYEIFLVLFPQACQDQRYKTNNRGEVSKLVELLLSDIPLRKNFSVPDTAKNPFVYLEQHNYVYENHTITTDDGYVLLVVRIPYGRKKSLNKKRPPVIFLHGIFCTFYDFLNAGPKRAIGFQILEEGYDIWLLNSRGNTYSKRHVTLDPVLNATKYWDFSWHEIGVHDVPATMDYISNITGYSNVSIVSHSQGGTIYLALASSRPEYDRRISFSIQLAPVSYLTYSMQPVILMLKNNLDIFDEFVKMYNWFEIFPINNLITRIGHTLCHQKSPYLKVCILLLHLIGGPSDQTNDSLFPVLSTNDPAGGTAKEIKHYIQIAMSDNFQHFDYGTEGNKLAYNQETPPLYNLSAITSPVAIFYGKSDFFISASDGARLAAEIPNSIHFVLGTDTNHLDVQWGTKAVENVHRPAIRLLNKYNNINNF